MVLAVVLALGCSWAIESGDDAFRVLFRIATGAAVAVAGAWTGTLLHALGRISPAQRWLITGAGLALGTLPAAFALDFRLAGDVWKAFLIVCAAASWVVVVPAFAAQPEQRNLMLRRVNGRFIMRVMGAGLYAAALFAGLALALRAIDILFELNLREEIYGHVFAWLSLGLVPWVTFGGLPDYVRPLDDVSAVTTLVHRLTRFLVPPLLALYYLILYAYAVRIAIVGELPKNLVSPMVIAAGLLGAAAIMLYDPERDQPAGLAALRLAPALFLPLAALGFWSLSPRIEQYGWTEFRIARFVLLLLLTGLALGGTVVVLRRRRLPLHYIPLAAAIVLALSAVGPFSVPAVARRSQQHQLAAALAEADLPAPVSATGAKRQVPSGTYFRINSVASYLWHHFGAAALEGLVAGAALEHARSDLSGFLGLEPAPQPGQKTPFFGNLEAGTTLQLGAGQTAYRVMFPRSSPDSSVIVRQDSTGLVITVRGEVLRVDIDQVAGTLTSGRGAPPLMQNAAVPVVDAQGTRRGTLIVFNISGNREPGNINISHLDGLLLLDATTPSESRLPGRSR